jgi:hypothetical protein
VLLGQPKPVVGTTNGASGQIRVDLTGLATDNDMRNQTIQSRILETANPSNQYAVFVTKSISGLPGSIAIGQGVVPPSD